MTLGLGGRLDHIIGVIDDAEQLNAAFEALIALGKHGDDLKVMSGSDDAARIDAHGQRGGLVHRAGRHALGYGVEGEQIAAYEREIRAGNFAFAVAVSDDGDKDAVADVLHAHNARRLYYYGRLTVEDLSMTAPRGSQHRRG